ncbi:hypothetical protein AG1IA_07886 [Rhizoctonia solani AG-1 IA]|uniref:Uncharacterized protein n=1 Tax=Thanatephorus cucumeris (strain AG1-IA) TaxID=983506 RepID=L8WP03_THACA|nr:hypothetical protein AG1IA_07886 [Rhizoctonia solani AG-1 IA]
MDEENSMMGVKNMSYWGKRATPKIRVLKGGAFHSASIGALRHSINKSNKCTGVGHTFYNVSKVAVLGPLQLWFNPAITMIRRIVPIFRTLHNEIDQPCPILLIEFTVYDSPTKRVRLHALWIL